MCNSVLRTTGSNRPATVHPVGLTDDKFPTHTHTIETQSIGVAITHPCQENGDEEMPGVLGGGGKVARVAPVCMRICVSLSVFVRNVPFKKLMSFGLE